MWATILTKFPGLSIIKNYATGILLAIILAVIAATGAYIFSLKSSISSLEKKNSTLTTENTVLSTNNSTLTSNLNICVDTNITQQSTISQLSADHEATLATMKLLATKSIENEQLIAKLRNTLGKLGQNPANNGPIAAVLRETIRGIQDGEVK